MRKQGISLRTWCLSAIGLLFLLVWFGGLGLRSLISPDEGRYAALSLGMLQSGDWITPRLNGILYFEKPPLQYWIGALSFVCLGINEFAARLWPGLAGLLTILAVGCTAWRLWGRETGIRALAIAGSTTWIIGNCHFLSLDAGLSLFLTLTLCGVLLAEQARGNARAQRRWVWLAWAAMAGAVMSKGLVGIVLPSAVLVLVSVWRRDAGLWRRMHWGSGLMILLLLTAPWFVLVSSRNPDFAQFFFVHEHFARYLSTAHQREGAWWYYLPFLLAGMLPWTGALPWLAQQSGPEAKAASARGQIAPNHVLLVWSAFVLLFFSASGSKLPSYILPMFPALALLLAMRLRDVSSRALRWHLLLPTLGWGLALLASTQSHRFASGATPAELLAPLASALRAGASMFLMSALLAWWLLGRHKITEAVLSLALGHFLAASLVIQAHDSFGQLKSAEPIAVALQPHIQPDTPAFAVRAYDQTLPFYLRRPVVLVDYTDEFAFGQQREATRAIDTLDAFAKRWQDLAQGVAYMDKPTWVELGTRAVPMRVVFEDHRRVVVLRR